MNLLLWFYFILKALFLFDNTNLLCLGKKNWNVGGQWVASIYWHRYFCIFWICMIYEFMFLKEWFTSVQNLRCVITELVSLKEYEYLKSFSKNKLITRMCVSLTTKYLSLILDICIEKLIKSIHNLNYGWLYN